MNYRCLTCGFVQDFEPTPENVVRNHPWMKGKDHLECPACHKYLAQHGGRKNGKIQMPDIATPGQLKLEAEITDEFKTLETDFAAITKGDKAVAAKYKAKKLFGWTGDELLQLRGE